MWPTVQHRQMSALEHLALFHFYQAHLVIDL